MLSDEALMLAFQNGSREAFEEIFARYRGPIRGFFARRLSSPERAEDLMQQTFLVRSMPQSASRPVALTVYSAIYVTPPRRPEVAERK